MEKLKDRIDIINSFKFLKADNTKATELRIRNSNIRGLIHMVLSICCIAVIFYAVITNFLGVEYGPRWEKSSILVICAINIVYSLSKDIYKRTLLKHLQFIEKSGIEDIDISLNDNLEEIISDLNKQHRNVYIILLGVLLVMGGLVYSLYGNPYWEYFKIPTILFFILMASETFRNLKKLNINIRQAEDQVLLCRY